MKNAYKYAKEDSIKIITNMKPGVISFVFRISWLLTLFLYYTTQNIRGNLK